jgi:hypothetical protein
MVVSLRYPQGSGIASGIAQQGRPRDTGQKILQKNAKCNALSGDAKERCMDEAKMYYTKQTARQEFPLQRTFNKEVFQMNTIQRWAVNAAAVILLFGLGGVP